MAALYPLAAAHIRAALCPSLGCILDQPHAVVSRHEERLMPQIAIPQDS
jgi:hypothetical protein